LYHVQNIFDKHLTNLIFRPQDVLLKLIEGMEVADIVVSTGGVSMGERDFLKEVLTNDLNAKIHFGSVLMKPGYVLIVIYGGIGKILFNVNSTCDPYNTGILQY
jgi:hypothetical protein